MPEDSSFYQVERQKQNNKRLYAAQSPKEWCRVKDRRREIHSKEQQKKAFLSVEKTMGIQDPYKTPNRCDHERPRHSIV